MRQKRFKTNMQTGEGKIALAIHRGAGTIAQQTNCVPNTFPGR
jgi:hypothetical protein